MVIDSERSVLFYMVSLLDTEEILEEALLSVFTTS